MKKKSFLSRKIVAIFASLLLLLNIIVPTGLVDAASTTDSAINNQLEKSEDTDSITQDTEETLPNEQVKEEKEIEDDLSVESNPKTVKQERGPPKKVTVRVEGNEKTIVEPTEIDVTTFDLKEYINNNNGGNSVIPETPRAIHAIIKGIEETTNLDLKDDDVFGLGSSGNYIQHLDGNGEFTDGPMSGWMYSVDNSYVPVGVLDHELMDGENIVLYYTTNFGDNTYSWFEEENYATEVDKDLELKLNTDNSNPVKNATLLIDDVVQENLVTDAEGNVTIDFDKAGTYHISATRSNDSGEVNLVRPYAKVEVKEKAVPEVPEVDKKTLENLIKEAESLNTENKTEESIAKLKETILNANTVNSAETSTQKDVDEAVKKLNKGINGLTDKPEEKPDPQTEEELLKKLNKSVDSAIRYAEKNFPDYTNDKPGSHSDYWAFSAFWGAGIKDIENEFNWKGNIKPSASHTFWEKKLSEKNRTSNEDAGTIIGAVILGQSPYDFGTQDVVADLEARQKDNGSFFHIHGEPWAMIALELVDSEKYDKDKHIDYILGLQDQEGMFGDADSTGWMLTALAPYKEKNPVVEQALDKSIKHIHKTYKDTGKLPGMKWGENSNAITSMHMGLASNGESLLSEKWTNDQNIIAEFIKEYQFEDGSFAWQAGSTIGAINMSTEQVILSFATIKEQESIFTQLKEEKNRVNIDALEKLVKKAKKIDTTNKTKKSIKALELTITESEAILENNIATQSEVDTAEKSLNRAIENLQDIPKDPIITIQSITEIDPIKVPLGTKEKDIEFPKEIELNLDNDKSLKTKVKWSLKEKSKYNYKQSGVYKYNGQYNLPANISGNKPEVTFTVTILEKSIDKTKLESLIVSANNIKTDGKTKKSIQHLAKSIKQAKEIINNDKASQKEVDQAIQKLNHAIKGLEKLSESKNNKEILGKLIKQVEKTDKSLLTKEDYAEFQAALERAKTVFGNKDADEKDLNQAIQNLEQAMSKSKEGTEKPKIELDGNQKDEDGILPSTASNIFNLLALGFVLIILGLLFVRKRKVS